MKLLMDIGSSFTPLYDDIIHSFYAYGLVIVDQDGSRSEPMHTFVTHNGVSSVKRTWGSIKALFR